MKSYFQVFPQVVKVCQHFQFSSLVIFCESDCTMANQMKVLTYVSINLNSGKIQYQLISHDSIIIS